MTGQVHTNRKFFFVSFKIIFAVYDGTKVGTQTRVQKVHLNSFDKFYCLHDRLIMFGMRPGMCVGEKMIPRTVYHDYLNDHFTAALIIVLVLRHLLKQRIESAGK